MKTAWEVIFVTWHHVRKEVRGWSLVFAILVAFAFFLLLGFLPNVSIVVSAIMHWEFSAIARLFVGLFYGIFVASPWYGWLLLVLIGVLTGVNAVLIKNRASRLRRAGVTGVGSVFGLMLGGCPSCASGILPAIGLAGGISFLPLAGTELSILGLLILLLSLYWNATAEQCTV